MADNNKKKYLDLNGLFHFLKKINEKKANIESPKFTGTPIAPTAQKGTNSAQIATTQYVQSEIIHYIAGDGIFINENNEISCTFANGMEVKY